VLSSGATSWSYREQETLDVDTSDKLNFGHLKGIPSQEVESSWYRGKVTFFVLTTHSEVCMMRMSHRNPKRAMG
jgi:hypothetical protein